MAKTKTPALTDGEIETLRVIIAAHQRRPSALRTGVSAMCSYRGDEGLKVALMHHAESEGLPLSECFNRAVEQYLTGK
ncbi:MAG: hypothetical protein JW384_03052 [Nitrosomonadaceae bacterium]|nr:hypothetical protein [Nitrosomonadaceae bacterium]